MKIRNVLAASLLASAAALGGCTSAQETSTLAAINTSCTLLGVGSQIAINVATGDRAQTLTQRIGTDVTSSCGLIVAGVQAAIKQITDAGQTATVTVSTVEPTGARRTMRFHAVPDRGTGEVTYVVPPGSLAGIPILGDLFRGL